MVELTVGYVAGFIALCAFLLQFVFPNVTALLLTASLGREATAITWSVVGGELQRSLWPSILRSDSAASTYVAWKVKIVVRVRLIAISLTALAAVITPLGLYDATVTSTNTEDQAFQYVFDDGPMGYGSPPRSDLGFTRTCQQKPFEDEYVFLPASCPGDDFVLDHLSRNGTEVNFGWNDTYDVRIPRRKAAFLQSGLDEQSSSM